MPATKPRSMRSRNLSGEENELSRSARFAISTMQGKIPFKPGEYTTFLHGVIELLEKDSLRALELLLSITGAKSLSNAMTLDWSSSFWEKCVVPLLKQLSCDELQLGCREMLTTKVFQSILNFPFFLATLKEFLGHDKLLDPALVLSIVDRVGSADKTVMSSPNFMSVVQALRDKLSGVMLEQLLYKFFQQASSSNAQAPLTDTSYNTLKEHRFDRHSNDHENIVDIEILPTKDELLCERDPYLPLASDPIKTPETLFDINFRWLREDVVAPMREVVLLLRSKKHKQKDPVNSALLKRLSNLTFGPVEMISLDLNRHDGTGFVVSFPHPKPYKKLTPKDMKKKQNVRLNHYAKYWKFNKNILRKGAVLMFIQESDGDFIRFGDILNGNHPKNHVQTDGESGICQITVRFDHTQFPGALSDMLDQRKKIMMVQVDVSFFAYKPVLKRLQRLKNTDFISDTLLPFRSSSSDQYTREGSSILSQQPSLQTLIDSLKSMKRSNAGIKSLLPGCSGARGSYNLDEQQCEAVQLALSSPVSLIQGPPGTGKSLCGAVIAAFLHRFTKLRVLCLCYTNHALDDFLHDLINIGIPDSDILRLGAGSCAGPNSSLENINLRVVKNASNIGTERSVRRLIGKTAGTLEDLETKAKELQELVGKMTRKSWRGVSEYLGEYEKEAVSAFETSEDTDGFTKVGNSSNRLWHFWITGKSPPTSCGKSVKEHYLWTLSLTARNEMLSQWIQDIASKMRELTLEYNKMVTYLQDLHDEKTISVFQRRRVIGCTTTGASIYSHLLDRAGIDVLIMEEAGEILEAHSIAAIGRNVRQMILIGDHLQLRPKIQHYLLSHDASNGRHGLDISLFERLMMNRVPYVCLEEQHRMCEPVATFVRQLTYPSLRSAPSVQSRRKLIGFPHSVIFVDHSELEFSASVEKGSGSSTSRTNPHEIDWVIAITEYILRQPEYSSDDIAILALYGDQLVLLREALRRCLNANARLNERDVADLVNAGEKIEMITPNGQSCRKEIRVSTVDNFQGEEGNIVIASLVRSNENGDIGFVAQSQRINVLLSRAREGMIFVGNSSTLMKSVKGGKMWKDVIDIFGRVGAFDRGINITCPTHGASQMIRLPREFAHKAPDGGCDQPCRLQLRCGHLCSRKCHRGSCTVNCEECRRLEQLKKEEERIAREKEERTAKRKEETRKREHEIQKMFQESRQKEDEAEHELQMRRLVMQQDLAKKELELMEKTSTEKVKHETSRLEHHYKQKKAEIDDRIAKSSQKDPVNPNTSISTGVTDQQDGFDTTTTKVDPNPLLELPFFDNKERNYSDSDSGDEKLQQTLEDAWEDLRLKVPSDERKSMDELMKLVGLASVKQVALEIFRKQRADQQLRVNGMNASIIQPTLNFSFVGNPGTGKTTVARLFAGILAESGARPSKRFEAVSASELLRRGEDKFEARICSMCGDAGNKAPPLGNALRRNLKVEVQCLDKRWYAATIINVDVDKNQYTVVYSSDASEEEEVSRERIRAGPELRNEGGVLFVDEAYDLAPLRNSKGAAIVNMIMEASEEHRENLTIILAGYQKDIEEQLFAFNDGMPSRFRQVAFDDFEVSELERIWKGLCVSNGYSCKSDVTRIAARRIAQGRQARGFGNARSVRTLFERSCTRRLQEPIIGRLQITAVDVLGHRPSLKQPDIAKVMQELKQLVGIPRVKEMFKYLLDLAKSNYDHEMEGSPPAAVPLNRVFVGNPGTGKTTVARLYGLMLKALGVLSNGEVVSKVASDLMGEYVGQAQQRTKGIIENARGKVLLIDEAYGLDEEKYGKQALDTIVERVSGAPGEDIAVVLVGYEKQIRLMIDRQNPGLKRRFNMESCKVVFDDFTDGELRYLIDLECRKAGVTISSQVRAHATKLLIKQRAKSNFGNAGNVVTLIKSAVGRWTARSGSKHNKELSIHDFDPSFEENGDPLAPLNDLEDTPVRDHLMDLALQIQQRKKEERSTDGLVGNYVFLGGPGTGKTTIARKLAKVLCEMGVLASDLVVETSSSDLIGSYIGHSRANVESKMKEARGGVCFIDEAYHLGVGQFGSEALTQLLTMLTLPEYMDGKTIVVLAGYERQVHKMLESNPGLKSRFTSYLHFDDWTSQKCVAFVCKLLSKEEPVPFMLDDKGKEILQDGFEKIFKRPGWANARDAIQLYKQIMKERDIRKARATLSAEDLGPSIISAEDISKAISTMLQARPTRSVSAARDHLPQTEAASEPQQRQGISSKQPQKESLEEDEATFPNDSDQVQEEPSRSDENQEDDKNPIEETRQEFTNLSLYLRLLEKVEELESSFTGDASDQHRKGIQNEKQRLERERAEAEELEREIRKAHETARKAKTKKARKFLMIARRKETALRKKLEKEKKRQAIVSALMSIGKCPVGYKWLRIGNGYRCAGGSHYARFEDIAQKTGLTTADVAKALKEG